MLEVRVIASAEMTTSSPCTPQIWMSSNHLPSTRGADVLVVAESLDDGSTLRRVDETTRHVDDDRFVAVHEAIE